MTVCTQRPNALYGGDKSKYTNKQNEFVEIELIREYPLTRNLPPPPSQSQCPQYVLKKVAWFCKFENLRYV